MSTIGVAVFVVKDNRILIGQRGPACKRGAGMYALPGGGVEPGERVEDASVREVFEETGMTIQVPRGEFGCNDFLCGTLGVSQHLPREDHFTFWVLAKWVSGEPQTVEPTKCLGWEWVDMFDALTTFKSSDEQDYWIPKLVWVSFMSKINSKINSGLKIM